MDIEKQGQVDGFTASAYFTDWQKIKFAPSMLDASDTIGFGQSPGQALAIGLSKNRDKPIISIMGDGAVGVWGGPRGIRRSGAIRYSGGQTEGGS